MCLSAQSAWEIELGYDEIKTEVLEREEAIRSKSPEAVGQELWGILLAYNLVRLEMERVRVPFWMVGDSATPVKVQGS